MEATESNGEAPSSKYWIVPGIFVTLRGGGPTMKVAHLERYRQTMPDGSTRSMVKGVKCYWTDGEEEKSDIFHTKDLVPA